jgi:hypothetical protein
MQSTVVLSSALVAPVEMGLVIAFVKGDARRMSATSTSDVAFGEEMSPTVCFG